MNALNIHTHLIGEFQAITLRNDDVALTVLPELGARFVSLQSIRAEREWLWCPSDGRGLFTSEPGTPFERSTLAGIDECLPTVNPIETPATFPDHGEVWSRAWETEIEDNTLLNRVTLDCVPLNFSRSIRLEGNTVHLTYSLLNIGSFPVRYVWAFHPLFSIQAGDTVQLAGNPNVTLSGGKGRLLQAGSQGAWPTPLPSIHLDRLDLGETDNVCVKAFIETRNAAEISLVGSNGRNRLDIMVDPTEISAWGYWLTRGGWAGHTHLALEPTNAPADSINDLPENWPSATLHPAESRQWTVKLRLH